jgi:hypothetical protein
MPISGLARPGPLLQCLKKRKTINERPGQACKKPQRSSTANATKVDTKSERPEEQQKFKEKSKFKNIPESRSSSQPPTKKQRNQSLDETEGVPLLTAQSDPFIEAEDKEIARLEKLLGISKGTLLSHICLIM